MLGAKLPIYIAVGPQVILQKKQTRFVSFRHPLFLHMFGIVLVMPAFAAVEFFFSQNVSGGLNYYKGCCRRSEVRRTSLLRQQPWRRYQGAPTLRSPPCHCSSCLCDVTSHRHESPTCPVLDIGSSLIYVT